MGIRLRENQGLRPVMTILSRCSACLRRYVLRLTCHHIASRDRPTEKNFRMQWIGRRVPRFTARAETLPVAQRNFRVTAARRRADRAAVLLRPGDPIWKTIIRCDVINLCRRLVVPGTPGDRAIDTYNCALIAAKHHALRIVRVNPELMKVIARRIAFDRGPCLTGICGSIDRSIHHIDSVCVFRIGGNFLEVPTAIP